MLELRGAMERSPFRHKLGLTSTDSYHMTIFRGERPGSHGLGVAILCASDAPIDVCSRMVGERMERSGSSVNYPCVYVLISPPQLTFAQLAVYAWSPPILTRMRSCIPSAINSQKSRFRLKDHAIYQFHITMSYQIAPFTADERSAYRELLAKHIKQITDAQPVLELGNPEYCAFPICFALNPGVAYLLLRKRISDRRKHPGPEILRDRKYPDGS